MATPQQVQTVLNSLSEVHGCPQCGTRFRFGDLDCPHCGADLEQGLHDWAEKLVDAIMGCESEMGHR